MTPLRRAALTAVFAVMLAAPASAAFFGETVFREYRFGPYLIELVNTGGVVPGFGTIDVFIDTGGDDLVSVQALTDLSSGSLFQNELLSQSGLPNPRFFGAFPTMQFDSFISIDGTGASFGHAAGDIGGSSQRFDTSGIDLVWFTSDTMDIGPAVHVARLTFSDDANGTLTLAFTLAHFGGMVSEPLVFNIVNGVPEPATLALLGVGGLAVPGRRRSA